MDRHQFHSDWNPPHGDIPFAAFDPPNLVDAKFANCKPFYRFPWYLRFMELWYGLKCWCSTGEWPIRVLYFDGHARTDRELYPKVLAEITRKPEEYFAPAPSEWNEVEDIEFEELFETDSN